MHGYVLLLPRPDRDVLSPGPHVASYIPIVTAVTRAQQRACMSARYVMIVGHKQPCLDDLHRIIRVMYVRCSVFNAKARQRCPFARATRGSSLPEGNASGAGPGLPSNEREASSDQLDLFSTHSNHSLAQAKRWVVIAALSNRSQDELLRTNAAIAGQAR